MVNINNIGIDIGGNHVGLGLVDENGNLLETQIVNYSNHEFNTEEVFDSINKFVNIHGKEAESIGIGVPGISSGTHIDYTCNLPLGNIDVRNYIETKLPIYMTNDANCAAIAEYHVVDRKIYSNYALITLGTGIGSGLILDSKLYTGTTGTAGEIGHMIIEKEGLECKCGRRGCFEQYASVTALKRMTETDSLKEIMHLCEINENIQNVFDNYLENLSEGLANFINIFDVEMLVIGGSLSNYGYKFLPTLTSKLKSKICNKYTYELNLKTAVLKNDAGIIGASLLAEYLN